MTLKDENAAVNAVVYRTNAQRIKYDLYDGLNVIVRGRVSLYEKSGQYQIIIDDIQPQGIGELALAFEQLKQKLSEKGMFSPEYKKPLPEYPQRIGVVTSATGAAIRDITNIISRRFPLAKMIIYPVEVQGVNAAPSISKAIKELNEANAADVLIVGRGGGSIEDLWAFNEEQVALAVFESHIPVISAVGHETDFTICDFVADIRAETPSAAAELCVPDKDAEMLKINSLYNSAFKLLENRVNNEKTKLSNLYDDRIQGNFIHFYNINRMLVDLTLDSVNDSFTNVINEKKHNFSLILKKLESLNPVSVLSRGYSVASKDGAVIKSKSDVSSGDRFELIVSDGKIDCEVV